MNDGPTDDALDLYHREGVLPTTADKDRISIADMATLMSVGEALPLFPELTIGPVFYGDVWWAVPQGPGQFERGYWVVDDSQQLQLSETARGLAHAAEVVEQSIVGEAPAPPFPERSGADEPGGKGWWRR